MQSVRSPCINVFCINSTPMKHIKYFYTIDFSSFNNGISIIFKYF